MYPLFWQHVSFECHWATIEGQFVFLKWCPLRSAYSVGSYESIVSILIPSNPSKTYNKVHNQPRTITTWAPTFTIGESNPIYSMSLKWNENHNPVLEWDGNWNLIILNPKKKVLGSFWGLRFIVLFFCVSVFLLVFLFFMLFFINLWPLKGFWIFLFKVISEWTYSIGYNLLMYHLVSNFNCMELLVQILFGNAMF